jgi:ADP-ribose pyrophosphatase YjhB (NUDIX family)
VSAQEPADTYVPPPANAMLGAGAVLLHDGKALLVRLNYGRFRGHWILPGGRVDPGEHPSAAAVREIREETGVMEARIDGQLAVRHRVLEGGQADVYWVFRASIPGLKPGDPFPPLRWPEEEIQEARLWPVAECLAHPEVRPLTRSFVRLALEGEEATHRALPLPAGHDADDEVFGACPLLRPPRPG